MAKKEPSLGETLKGLREEADLTAEDVQEKTGYNLSTISKIENDKTFPKYYTISDLADCYGCYIDFPKKKPENASPAAKPALKGKCLPCEGLVVKRLTY